MKKHLKVLCLVLAILVPPGCSPSPDLLLDNQQVATTVAEDAAQFDCDTIVITCIDHRFAVANQEFINDTLGLKDNYDHISIPGSIYNMVNPETRDLLFSKFTLSVRLHLIKRVIIISHKDCGAYGGSASFGSEIAEYENLCADLWEARTLLIEKYPTLEVDLYLESLAKEGERLTVRFEKIPHKIY